MTKLWQVLWSTRENRKDQRWEANHLKSNIVGVQIGAEMSLSALSSRILVSDAQSADPQRTRGVIVLLSHYPLWNFCFCSLLWKGYIDAVIVL